MAGFPKKERQRIIDEYLAASGRNMFIPREFVDWLRDYPDHEAYDWFYGMDDAEAAQQHRIQLARQMASGLRIVVQDSDSRGSGGQHNREGISYVYKSCEFTQEGRRLRAV